MVLRGVLVGVAIAILVVVAGIWGASTWMQGRPSRQAQRLVEQARTAEGTGRLAEAEAVYERLLLEFADHVDHEDIWKRLGHVKLTLLLLPNIAEGDRVYTVQAGDTLGEIARHYGVTVEVLQRANSLAGDLIRPGQELRVPEAVFRVAVDKSDNVLTLLNGEDPVRIYRVATGNQNITPVGTFTIVNKLVDPVWYTAGAVIPAESPENMLGTRWLGLSKRGYGIHGTTDPESIGQQITAGCVRMRNRDIEELFTLLPVGTEVTIKD